MPDKAIRKITITCTYMYLVTNRYARENIFRSDRGDRPGVKNYLVIVTDGKSDNPSATWQQAMDARNASVHHCYHNTYEYRMMKNNRWF